MRWMSCSRRRFFGPSFDEALGGVDHEDALAGGGVLLVEHDDAGRNAGAVKEIRGQADDALEVAGADELLADHGLGIAAEEHAMRQNAGAFAGALHRADDVQQVGVVALLSGRHAPGEALEAVVATAVRPVVQVLSENGGLATT